MTRALLVLLIALAALAPDASAQAGKRDEKRRQQALERLAKKLAIPEAELAAAGAERWAGDVAARKALLVDLGARPRGALLPLVVDAALHEPDFDARRAAVKLLSVVGLDADRAAYLAALPAFTRLLADKSELIFQDAGDELLRLERWYGCDAEVVPLLERAFRGENLRVAQRAFQGLLQVEEPGLRLGPVKRAALEVLDKKSRFNPNDRKRAVLAIPKGLREVASPGALAATMHEDGPIAVEIAQVLGELGDPSVLPQLRRVDRTSSHALRIPAYHARGKLGDELLLAELPAALDSDHLNIQLAILEGLQWPKDPRIDVALSRLQVADEAVRRAVALCRVARGDAAAAPGLVPLVEGPTPDGPVSGRALRIESPAVAPLVRAIARNPAQEGRRERAVDRLGDARLVDDAARELLVTLATEGGPSALRLRAAASLLQLAPPEAVGPVTSAQAVAAVTSALVDLDVVSREDAATGLGTARRFSGSPLLDVVERLAKADAVQAAPLLSEWLEPAPVKAAPKADEAGSSQRKEGAATPQTPDGPPFVRHAFVRRGVVAALGQLTLALAAKVEASDGPARAARDAERSRAIAALARCLDDPAGVVRAEATRALARVSGVDRLPPGAALAVEEEVRTKLRAWLAARR